MYFLSYKEVVTRNLSGIANAEKCSEKKQFNVYLFRNG